MEVAGLAMAVRSLLAKTSLEGYRIVSSLRSFKEDFGRLHYQFEIEHTKLKDWLNKAIDASDASGASDASISSKLSEMSTTDQGRVRLIASTFVSVRQMESLYGVRVTMDHVTKATENPRKRDLLNPRRLLRHVRSTSKDSMSIDVPKVPGTLLTDGELDLNLDIAKLQIVAPDIQFAVSSYERFTWVFSNQEKLEALIKQLQQYNNNLEYLLNGYVQMGMEYYNLWRERHTNFESS
jgi:hypothetical protein